MSFDRDIGSQIAVIHGFNYMSSAAGDITTASTASMGDVIDRLALTGNYHSVRSLVSLGARVASTSGDGYYLIGLRLETGDSSNSTALDATHSTEQTYVVGTTADGVAANDFGVFYQDIDLSSAERFIRQVVTITKYATSSFDDLAVSGVLVFGGASVLPATS